MPYNVSGLASVSFVLTLMLAVVLECHDIDILIFLSIKHFPFFLESSTVPKIDDNLQRRDQPYASRCSQ